MDEIITKDEECVELQYPNDLQRANESDPNIRYDDILPFKDQPGYTPDPATPLYFDIVDDAESFVADLRTQFLENKVVDEAGERIWIESNIPDGTPIAPKAATAPRQFAKKKLISYNSSTTLEVWEWCVSGKGEPTRSKATDGLHGRSSNPILIQQPKNRSPGWDGCRELNWKHPSSRSDHKAVSINTEQLSAIIFYGGVGYVNPSQSKTLEITPATSTMDDLWIYNVHNCIHNCSNHGICKNGFCTCDEGYYGIDCSNYTCPGSVCYYDDNHVQHCKHCCHDGYNPSDDGNSMYIAGVRKRTCSAKNGIFTGTSEGICDGFGTCQCAPPFIGDDCSMRDCKDDKCNSNGYCSAEYPVSRCICNPGYFGDACQYIECLNNCTYGNGECDYKTGTCKCRPLYSPQADAVAVDPNNTDEHNDDIYGHWEGEDCSWISVWADGWQLLPQRKQFTASLCAAASSILFLLCFTT